jgi:succinate dehydrogenase/fumarate reductase-like Fe-S protein
VKVKVFRGVGNPAKDAHFDEFEVPYTIGLNVMGVLEYIYNNLDSSLSYYKSCRIGRCTGCFVRRNGKNVLSCDQAVNDEDMVIEPLPKFLLIKDLVVDFSKGAKPGVGEEV